MKIPFYSLKEYNKNYEKVIVESINRVLNSGWYISGSEVQLFEKEYAEYVGSNFCIGVGNGLDAIRLILEAYKLTGKLGNTKNEVIVPANTYIATILAITQAGLKPVLVDPNPKTFLLEADSCRRYISNKTGAVIVVDLYGQVPNYDKFHRLKKEFNLPIISDAAQSHGGQINNKRVGSLCDATAFSFYPGKNLGALGDAGAITTNDESVADFVSTLRNYGSKKKYVNDVKGFNSRLDEIQAAILRSKLPNLDKENSLRKKIAKKYLTSINNNKIKLPFVGKSNDHVWHQFIVKVDNRSNLKKYLLSKGIETLVHYPIPPHKQSAYSEFNKLSFPITEDIHSKVLSLPISPRLSKVEVSYCISTLNEY